ncbi:MAG: hypothetical protein M3493_02530 [Actinomycetota bacterium]|nr:hypothetical protein [Euzebyaceae bacterium]MDQ3451572.1 hypothetical protein [Actinomycetota bacterium]
MNQMSDAMAHAIVTFAHDTSAVNGVTGSMGQRAAAKVKAAAPRPSGDTLSRKAYAVTAR